MTTKEEGTLHPISYPRAFCTGKLKTVKLKISRALSARRQNLVRFLSWHICIILKCNGKLAFLLFFLFSRATRTKYSHLIALALVCSSLCLDIVSRVSNNIWSFAYKKQTQSKKMTSISSIFHSPTKVLYSQSMSMSNSQNSHPEVQWVNQCTISKADRPQATMKVYWVIHITWG